MIDVSSARIVRCSVHHVGNRLREEGIRLSSEEVQGDAALHETLLAHYLAPLATERLGFEFFHESDLDLNAVRQFATKAFEKPDAFLKQSQSIAKHLYAASTHPSINGGELISILYQDVRVDGTPQLALGVYKVEERETFLDVIEKRGEFNLIEHDGIPARVQKGALILGSGSVYSKESGSSAAKYWAESFLKIRPLRTSASSARAAASFVKAISERLDVESKLELRHHIDALVGTEDALSFSSIKSVGDQFLGSAATSEILGAIEDRSGFTMPGEHSIESSLFRKESRAMSRLFPLIDGVSLSLSASAGRLKSCGVQKTKTGTRITIDIDAGVN